MTGALQRRWSSMRHRPTNVVPAEFVEGPPYGLRRSSPRDAAAAAAVDLTALPPEPDSPVAGVPDSAVALRSPGGEPTPGDASLEHPPTTQARSRISPTLPKGANDEAHGPLSALPLAADLT
jgi:hypothetical protein